MRVPGLELRTVGGGRSMSSDIRKEKGPSKGQEVRSDKKFWKKRERDERHSKLLLQLTSLVS